MSIRAGIKKFGERGNEALLKELRQIHERRQWFLKRKMI